MGPSPAQTQAKTICVYNEYRPNVARYHALSAQQEAELTQYYNDLRDRVMPEGAAGFVVNLSKQTASYIENGETKVVYLTARDKGDAEAVERVHQAASHAEHLISTEIYHGPVRTACFRPDQKGSTGRPLPLGRPASLGVQAQGRALGALGQHATDAGRGEARWERVADAKAAKLERLRDEQEQLAQAANPDRQAITEVEADIRRTENLDDFALQAVLMYYPEADASKEDVLAAAIQLQRRLEATLGAEGRAYSIEVAGLMFAGLPDAQSREAYGDYCGLYQIRMKPDREEDKAIRDWFNHEREHGAPAATVSGAGIGSDEEIDG